MKKQLFFLCIIISFYVFGCHNNEISEPNIKVYYDYSFSNKHVISSDDTTLTYVHNGKKEFDDYFFMIYEFKTPTLIPAEDFDNRIFISFIKYGLYTSEITLSKSVANGESLDLYFNSIKHPTPSTYFAFPVIVSIPKSYTKVRITENNKFLREMKIK